MSERYLLVKHSEGWNVDRCCRWMDSNGKCFDWFYPLLGAEFPNPAGYTGVIVFGGAPSANDDDVHDWVRPELAFIEACLKEEVGFFGICLGAQMLARVLGSTISLHPEGLSEIGPSLVMPTEAGKHFLPEPMTVMQWHKEGFTLPAGAISLARSEVFENQAFQLSDRVFGVQFHPEVNPEALAIWQARNREKSPDHFNDEQRAAMMAKAELHDATVSAWLSGFLHSWCDASCRPLAESKHTSNG